MLMVYDIVHETVILKLSDGRYLHLDSRSPSDSSGEKSHSEFSAAIYTKDELLKKAEEYQRGTGPYVETGQFDIMIRNRKASWYDYGSHLIRLMKRSKPYSFFVNHRIVHVYTQKSTQFIKPEEIIVPSSEFRNYISLYLYTGEKIAYRHITEEIDRNNEQEVIAAIEQGHNTHFIIGKLDHSLTPAKPRRKK